MLIMLHLVQNKFLEINLQFFDLDPSESMFMSFQGMSQSIDLESSYTSSRPDTASISSKIDFSFHIFSN